MINVKDNSKDTLGLKGTWIGKILTRDGHVRDEFEVNNLVVDEGIEHILDVAFNSKTQTATYYMALNGSNINPSSNWQYIDMGTGGTFTEFVAYDESTRPVWATDAAANKAVTNSTPASFTISAGGGTVYGGIIVSNGVKDDATASSDNVMVCALNFGSPKVLAAAEVIQIQYTLAMTSV